MDRLRGRTFGFLGLQSDGTFGITGARDRVRLMKLMTTSWNGFLEEVY